MRGRILSSGCGSAAALVAAMMLSACGGDGKPAKREAQTETSPPSVAVSPTVAAPQPLVGSWSRVTTCKEAVQSFRRAGFDESFIQKRIIPGLADPANGWLPGGKIADPTRPCERAVPREHSHFWTEFGTFGSHDWKGNQVDEGTYEVIDDHTLVMPYGFEQGPPIQVEFRYQIDDDTLSLDPVIPSDCSTERCLEAALWSVSVAYPGETWERVS